MQQSLGLNNTYANCRTTGLPPFPSLFDWIELAERLAFKALILLDCLSEIRRQGGTSTAGPAALFRAALHSPHAHTMMQRLSAATSQQQLIRLFYLFLAGFPSGYKHSTVELRRSPCTACLSDILLLSTSCLVGGAEATRFPAGSISAAWTSRVAQLTALHCVEDGSDRVELLQPDQKLNLPSTHNVLEAGHKDDGLVNPVGVSSHVVVDVCRMYVDKDIAPSAEGLDEDDDDDVLSASVVGLSMSGRDLLVGSMTASTILKGGPSLPSMSTCTGDYACGMPCTSLRVEKFLPSTAEDVVEASECTFESAVSEKAVPKTTDMELPLGTCWNVYINPVFNKSCTDSAVLL
ncbi:hypothetical protein CEUSTIGMA_g7911.t1 [Chlamydomonas eustigma]|uniref:Uncharacterized protein n=1 Tax=Chlamydomonas eustigma TaxID=1157962 RepID=A0A250XC76_9CHLO|nr:hypothetical protein CEUSTIGMA_g7911.t1 [Chlamydomonas eustigma]|eukprot:GAX80472.1 hypothetical protein CEUSTIGMA_g7911.t1 [Chlamydomonas eustigma]